MVHRKFTMHCLLQLVATTLAWFIVAFSKSFRYHDLKFIKIFFQYYCQRYILTCKLKVKDLGEEHRRSKLKGRRGSYYRPEGRVSPLSWRLLLGCKQTEMSPSEILLLFFGVLALLNLAQCKKEVSTCGEQCDWCMSVWKRQMFVAAVLSEEWFIVHMDTFCLLYIFRWLLQCLSLPLPRERTSCRYVSISH